MVSILALGCTLIFSFITILKNTFFIYILKIETQELKNKNPVKYFLTVEEPIFNTNIIQMFEAN